MFSSNSSCIEGCAECISPFWCHKCKTGYSLQINQCILTPSDNCQEKDAAGCLICLDGFTYTNKQCSKGKCSMANCLSCGYKGCSKCKEGYTPSNGQCLQTPCSELYPNCQQCDINGCLTCQDGSYLQLYSRNCTTISTLWPMYTVVLSLLLLAGPLYLRSYCRKQREQKRKIQDADAIQSMNESLIKKGKAFFLYHKNFYIEDYNERDKKALLEQPIYRHIENAKDENFIEANLYMYSFQLGVFLKVFLIDLLYALGIGTLLLPFSKCIFRWRFMNNTSYFENQRIVQFLGVFTLIYIIYGIWSNTLWQVNTQALEYFEGLLFICVTNASIAAFMNPQIPKLLSSYALKTIPDTNRFHWKFIFNDKDIEQEVNSTFLRLNIDASLFYATFLQGKIPAIFLRHYKNKEAVDISGLLENLQGLLDDFQQNMVLNKSLPIILYHTPVPASELLNKIPFF